MIKLALGGNKSGKTVIGAIEVAAELCGMHPLQLAGKRHMPPMDWRGVAVSFIAVEEKLEPELERWIPKHLFLKWDIRKHVLTLTNGSKVDFMAYEQDTNKFGQVEKDGIWFDEEPPEDIYNESVKRLIGKHGRIIITETPEYGMTWVYDKIWLRGISNAKPDNDFWAVNPSIWDNPYITDDEKRRALDKITDPLMRKIAETGSWVEFMGLIFPEFKRLWHADFEPFPLAWPIEGSDKKLEPTRFMAIDPMDREVACLWMAVYPNGRIVFYDELVMEDATTAELAEAIKAKDGGKIRVRWMDHNAWGTDPTSRSSMAFDLAKHGIKCHQAQKGAGSFEHSKMVCKEYLKMRDEKDNPRIVIFKTLNNLIYQMMHYVHGGTRRYEREHSPKNLPKKKDDHLCDCFRYLLTVRPKFLEVGQTVKLPKELSGRVIKSKVTGYERWIQATKPFDDKGKFIDARTKNKVG